MKKMKKVLNIRKFVGVIFLIGCCVYSQEEEKVKEQDLKESRNLTWEGNKELSENHFVAAEATYRKAISKSDKNVTAPYNLGNAYYNKETYSEAFGRFKQAGELANDKSEKHRAYHNLGNVFMKKKEYEKAVEAYKEALRNNPTDEETRYNLALAKEMLKKEQEKNDQNKDDKDKNQENKDDKKDQNKEEGDKGDKGDQDQKDKKDEGDQGDEKKEDNKEGEGDKKEEQKKQPNQGDKSEEQKEPQPRPNQLSRQQVQNLLDAMQNEEKKVQEKIDAQKVKGVKLKSEKDW